MFTEPFGAQERSEVGKECVHAAVACKSRIWGRRCGAGGALSAACVVLLFARIK